MIDPAAFKLQPILDSIPTAAPPGEVAAIVVNAISEVIKEVRREERKRAVAIAEEALRSAARERGMNMQSWIDIVDAFEISLKELEK